MDTIPVVTVDLFLVLRKDLEPMAMDVNALPLYNLFLITESPNKPMLINELIKLFSINFIVFGICFVASWLLLLSYLINFVGRCLSDVKKPPLPMWFFFLYVGESYSVF